MEICWRLVCKLFCKVDWKRIGHFVEGCRRRDLKVNADKSKGIELDGEEE